MRPRMVLRALRPPMLFGASLPGMIFPAQRPAEGSNSYHYGSYKSRPSLTVQEHGPVLRKNSCELLVPSCKLKSKGKGVNCRHSDKVPGRNLAYCFMVLPDGQRTV